ncbi:MAG: DUF4280 domain-containing protein [Tepidiformaceae bacterium]
MMCSFGAAPSTLIVVPEGPPVMFENKLAATIMANIPMANIPPFGMCMSIANPTVAAATTAALGVLTPMPCIPALTAPWVPPVPTVLVNNKPIVDQTAQLMCMWAGVIAITNPGTTTEMVP